MIRLKRPTLEHALQGLVPQQTAPATDDGATGENGLGFGKRIRKRREIVDYGPEPSKRSKKKVPEQDQEEESIPNSVAKDNSDSGLPTTEAEADAEMEPLSPDPEALETADVLGLFSKSLNSIVEQSHIWKEAGRIQKEHDYIVGCKTFKRSKPLGRFYGMYKRDCTQRTVPCSNLRCEICKERFKDSIKTDLVDAIRRMANREELTKVLPPRWRAYDEETRKNILGDEYKPKPEPMDSSAEAQPAKLPENKKRRKSPLRTELGKPEKKKRTRKVKPSKPVKAEPEQLTEAQMEWAGPKDDFNPEGPMRFNPGVIVQLALLNQFSWSLPDDLSAEQRSEHFGQFYELLENEAKMAHENLPRAFACWKYAILSEIALLLDTSTDVGTITSEELANITQELKSLRMTGEMNPVALYNVSKYREMGMSLLQALQASEIDVRDVGLARENTEVWELLLIAAQAACGNAIFTGVDASDSDTKDVERDGSAELEDSKPGTSATDVQTSSTSFSCGYVEVVEEEEEASDITPSATKVKPFASRPSTSTEQTVMLKTEKIEPVIRVASKKPERVIEKAKAAETTKRYGAPEPLGTATISSDNDLFTMVKDEPEDEFPVETLFEPTSTSSNTTVDEVNLMQGSSHPYSNASTNRKEIQSIKTKVSSRVVEEREADPPKFDNTLRLAEETKLSQKRFELRKKIHTHSREHKLERDRLRRRCDNKEEYTVLKDKLYKKYLRERLALQRELDALDLDLDELDEPQKEQVNEKRVDGAFNDVQNGGTATVDCSDVTIALEESSADLWTETDSCQEGGDDAPLICEIPAEIDRTSTEGEDAEVKPGTSFTPQPSNSTWSVSVSLVQHGSPLKLGSILPKACSASSSSVPPLKRQRAKRVKYSPELTDEHGSSTPTLVGNNRSTQSSGASASASGSTNKRRSGKALVVPKTRSPPVATETMPSANKTPGPVISDAFLKSVPLFEEELSDPDRYDTILTAIQLEYNARLEEMGVETLSRGPTLLHELKELQGIYTFIKNFLTSGAAKQKVKYTLVRLSIYLDLLHRKHNFSANALLAPSVLIQLRYRMDEYGCLIRDLVPRNPSGGTGMGREKGTTAIPKVIDVIDID